MSAKAQSTSRTPHAPNAVRRNRAHRRLHGAAREICDEADRLAHYQAKIAALRDSSASLGAQLDAVHLQLLGAHESVRLFSILFNNAPVGYVVHNAAGIISTCNQPAAAMLGVSPRKVSGLSLLRCVAKERLDELLDHLRRSIANPTQSVRTELSLCRQGGEKRPVELITHAPIPPGHSPRQYFTALIDIRQRLAAEAALTRTQRNYHQLVDTVEGIVWEADARTLQVNFVSEYARRLLGYPLAEWGRPGFWQSHIYVEDRERVANEVARAVSRRERLQTEYRVMTASRELLWLHDTFTVAERDGALVLLGVAIDVTERHKAEDELRQVNASLEQRVAERTEEYRRSAADLEAFSYSISHDLRSPVRAMLGFATLAVEHRGKELPPEVRDYLERIASGARRADKLIQDVLAYSRLARESMRLEPVDLEKLLREIIAQYSEFQPPRARIHLRPPLLPVLAHEACLAQCITNLLGNAIKFIAPSTTPRVEVTTQLVDSKVRIWFKDNGIGIEHENLSRIFRIFERVHASQQYEGTGIGLAIVRKGVERQGGTVGVESQPGRGSRFWIQLNQAKP